MTASSFTPQPRAAYRKPLPSFAWHSALVFIPGTAPALILEGESIVHCPDVMDNESYRNGDPIARAARRPRSVPAPLLVVAATQGRNPVGHFVDLPAEVRPFSDKQIALLQNFAAQAVIAMENARLITETREALEQQTATAEVLQVINSSPGDLAPVFDAMLEKAHSLCGAAFGGLLIFEGDEYRVAAVRAEPGLAQFWRERDRWPLPPRDENTPLPRLMRGERLVNLADAMDDDGYRESGRYRELVDLGGARALLAVPLRKDDALLGVVTAFRQEARPFSEREVALIENFAAQAVIAMENARLITETREALEQQTATAEVLQVINSSPGDLGPVFDAMLGKATRLCDAKYGQLATYSADGFRGVAAVGLPMESADYLSRIGHPPPETVLGRVERTKQTVQMADIAQEPSYEAVFRINPWLRRVHTALIVPLLKEGELVGTIHAFREEVRPFTDKQIALLQNFAAQAVIAMENARLLTETREALEQQTATAEVLQVINSSPGDLAPVFDAMLEKALRLCDAAFGNLWTYDGEVGRLAAIRGASPEYRAELMRAGPQKAEPGGSLIRLVEGEPLIHIADISTGGAYRSGNAVRRMLADRAGARTVLWVPLRKDGALLGFFAVYRTEVRPFTEKQIALLQNFAAQAVIAIENARLLSELRQRTHDLQESLEYQTAISDVLRVISSSAFDLESVLQTVVTTAVRLCRADSATIYRNEGGEYRWAAGHMLSPEYEEIERAVRIQPGMGTVVGRVALARETIQILDAWTDPLYEVKDDARVGGVHTMIGVPLLREGVAIGALGLARRRVEAFSEKRDQLVTTFADQAVIAIENARLVNELRQRTGDLEESLEYQTATSDVLKAISRSGAALRPVLDTLVETATRICLADNGLIFQLKDHQYHMAASVGFPPEFNEHHLRHPTQPGRGTVTGRVALERRVVHIEDATADPEYTAAKSEELGQTRTMLGVPLFRGDAVTGVITLSRLRVEPFAEKQIELVRTFADQAVIAIENARLFDELRTRTAELGRSVDELRALNEVAQAVSSTLDLRAVLSTILTAIGRALRGGCWRRVPLQPGRAVVPPGRGLWLGRRVAGFGRRSGCRGGRDRDGRGGGAPDPDTALRSRRTAERAVARRQPRRRVPRRADRAAGRSRAHSRGTGVAAPRSRRIPSRDGAADADLGQPVGLGDPERAIVPRDRRQERATGACQPAQIAVPGQYEP